MRFTLGDRVVRGAYSVGAMTDPAMRGRGCFVRIGRHLYRRLEEEGFAFVAGFSNRNSYRLTTGPLGRTSVRPFPWAVRVLKPVSLARTALGCRRSQASPSAHEFAACEEDGVLVSRAGVPAAYVVSRPLEMRGIHALFLVDFVLADGEDAAGMVLLRVLTRAAREEGAEILSALLPGSGPARRALRKTGFRRVPEALHPQLIRFSLRGLGRYAGHPTLANPGCWSLSWADTDVV